MRIRFTLLRGKDAGQVRRFRLERGQQVVVGRHEECDLPLWDEAASRRHALLEITESGLQLVDLGSSNGTYVEGRPVDRRVLSGGERVRIGETEFRIETEGFQRRETVVLRQVDDYTVESSVRPADLDLGASMGGSAVQSNRLNRLLELVDAVQAEEDGGVILRRLLEVAAAASHATRAAVIPCASRTDELLWSEAIESPADQKQPAISRSIVQQVVSEGNALRISDTRTDPLTRSRESIVRRDVGSIVAVPVAAGERRHAVLYLERSGSAAPSPFDEADLTYTAKLAQVAGMALQSAEKLHRSRRLLERRDPDRPQELLTESAALRTSLEHLARFAASGGPLLIVGETGSGKELLASAAHAHGPYSEGPFVPVNCAAIPSALLESELFGHEKGAFTGATGRKAGMFELASDGTLFLDEIGELPLELQPKLLRVLETGEFFRVGGRAPVHVRLLVVSATHRDLEAWTREGHFREDLFFRLSRFRVDAPPLRERPEDIVLLGRTFLERICHRLGDRQLELGEAALRALVSYSWPGNVRELRNVMERAAVVAPGDVIEPSDLLLGQGVLSPEVAPGAAAAPRSLEEVEEEAIRVALRHTGGKKGEAAQILGIAWPTLRRKLRKYEIDAERP